MPFKPGNKLGKGRPKGSKNKFTTLKESFIEAYLKLGGTKGLIKWIESSPKNKAAFYHDLIRLIPSSQLTASETQNLTYQLSEKFLPKMEFKIERIITDKRPEEAIMRMPRPEDELPEQPKPEESKVIEIESLPTTEIEAEVKVLEEKKKKEADDLNSLIPDVRPKGDSKDDSSREKKAIRCEIKRHEAT